jgi:serine/threonine protein phosphatase 1
MGKIFVIGDIHGCLQKVENLMSDINIDDQQDTVVFLGDYIDRGPDSFRVVEFILDFKEGKKNVFCLLGNHEDLFLDYLMYDRNRSAFYMNGGFSTLISYNHPHVIEDIPERHRQFFISLMPYYETEAYIFVHAGLKPAVTLENQKKFDLLWIRTEFIDSHYDFGKTVVFGHTNFSRPLIEANKIGIDTGAVYGGKLTCIELPEKKVYQS